MICDIKFSSSINHQKILEYGSFLYSKLNTAKNLDFHDAIICGEKAKIKECHKNARYFCMDNPSFELVHGWLVIDARPILNSIKFIAHSVVKSPEGELLDVTPVESLDPRPFLIASLDNDCFEEFVSWLHENNLNGIFNYQIK